MAPPQPAGYAPLLVEIPLVIYFAFYYPERTAGYVLAGIFAYRALFLLLKKWYIDVAIGLYLLLFSTVRWLGLILIGFTVYEQWKLKMNPPAEVIDLSGNKATEDDVKDAIGPMTQAQRGESHVGDAHSGAVDPEKAAPRET